MDQQVAVSGYKGQKAWYDAANQAQLHRCGSEPRGCRWATNPRCGNDVVPKELRYDPKTNPKGARPTIWDVSRAPHTAPIPRPALRCAPMTIPACNMAWPALNAGIITKAQFIDLNARIGGPGPRQQLCARAHPLPDESALKTTTYEVGTNLGGNGGLSSVPVIDFGSPTTTPRAITINGTASPFCARR